MPGRPGRPRKYVIEDIETEKPESEQELLELSDFFDGLGSNETVVKIYRLLPPNKKEQFLEQGLPADFSEAIIQQKWGAGDYKARARMNGQRYSKNFSIAALPGADGLPAAAAAHHTELDKLHAQIESQKAMLESQRLEMEQDRRNREQRNHELQLKMLENRGNGGASITEMISGVAALKNLSGHDGTLTGAVKEVFELAKEMQSLRGGTGGDGNPADDSLTGIIKSILPEIPSIVKGVIAARMAAMPATTPAPAAIFPMPAGRPVEPDAIPAPNPPAPVEPAAIQAAPAASIDPLEVLRMQLRGIFQSFQQHVSIGALTPELAVENMLAIDETPLGRFIFGSIDKAANFETWLSWLKVQIGIGAIDDRTEQFLAAVYRQAKASITD